MRRADSPGLLLLVAVFACLPLVRAAAAETVVHRERSLYRTIVVYEDEELRCMSFARVRGTGRQSCQALNDPNRFVLNYTKMMMGALYLNPEPRRILIIGLGGGTLPAALARLFPPAQIDAVEIDPAVVQVAQKFFGFKTGAALRVHEEDGRVFAKRAARAGAKYDLIMLDAFDHEYIPEHLLTREFLVEVRSLMTKDGVLAANTFSNSRLYDHESATYASVFGDFYNLKSNNRVVIATMGALPSQEVLQRNADRLEERLRTLDVGRDGVLPLFSTKRDWNPEARILTDQYSPANLLNTPP